MPLRRPTRAVKSCRALSLESWLASTTADLAPGDAPTGLTPTLKRYEIDGEGSVDGLHRSVGREECAHFERSQPGDKEPRTLRDLKAFQMLSFHTLCLVVGNLLLVSRSVFQETLMPTAVASTVVRYEEGPNSSVSTVGEVEEESWHGSIYRQSIASLEQLEIRALDGTEQQRRLARDRFEFVTFVGHPKLYLVAEGVGEQRDQRLVTGDVDPSGRLITNRTRASVERDRLDAPCLPLEQPLPSKLGEKTLHERGSFSAKVGDELLLRSAPIERIEDVRDQSRWCPFEQDDALVPQPKLEFARLRDDVHFSSKARPRWRIHFCLPNVSGSVEYEPNEHHDEIPSSGAEQ